MKDDPRATKFLGRPALAIGWLVAATASCNRSVPPTGAPFRFAIEFPDSVEVANGLGIKLGLSRDGSQLAIVGMKAGRRAIYLRRSDELQAHLIPGTDSGFSPSFSPDGQWLLFHQAGGRLLKLRLEEGTPEPVVDSAVASSWGDDGFIVYQKGNAIWRVKATGGDAQRVAAPDASQGFRRYGWPDVLPGGKHALITAWRGSTNLDSARLAVISLDDGRVTDLGAHGVNGHYAAPGHIVFARTGGALAAVPFSPRKRAVTGDVVPLLENMWTGDGGGTDFSVAENGVLAYHGGMPNADLVNLLAVDRAGKARTLEKFGRDRFLEPRISPDGRHMVVAIGPPPPARTGDIWVYDLESAQRKQLTTAGVNQRPEWTPDGTRIVYISQQGDSQFVVARRWDGSGEPEVLARGVEPAFYELSMGPAHGWSAVRSGLGGGSGIRVAPTDSFSQLRAFDAKAPIALTPRVSPNGRLIAYVAAEAGRREVFVRPIAGGSDVAVSKEGGTEPVWSSDGSTLYFRGLTHLMSASIAERGGVVVGSPVTLLQDTFRLSVAHTGYDVFPSGREFLVLTRWGREHTNAYILVNWTQALLQRRPQGSPGNR